MAKQTVSQDDLKEMEFPYGGINLVQPSFLKGHTGTAEVAENVRFFDPLEHRGRGGSRPGLSRFVPDQVSGDHEIQHLAVLVNVDGTMIDWSFDGPNQEFPGIYGGIGFIDFDANLLPPLYFPTIPDNGAGGDGFGGETFQGGSGYPPKDAHKKTTISIEASNSQSEITETILITVTLVDGDGNSFGLSEKYYRLYTDPADEVGDQFTSTALGSPQVEVTATEPKTVTYRAKAFNPTGAVAAISNRVKVEYVHTKLTVTINWSNPANIDEGTALSGTQLNATASAPGHPSVPGAFVYTPASGTVLAAGPQTLRVVFVPTDPTTYSTPAAKTVTLTVSSTATPPDPADYISAALTGPGPGTSPVSVVMTTGTISVTAQADPGSVALPNDDPGWGAVADDNLNNPDGLVSYPFSVSARYVDGAWYYYEAPF